MGLFDKLKEDIDAKIAYHKHYYYHEHLEGHELNSRDPEWEKTPHGVYYARFANKNRREVIRKQYVHAVEDMKKELERAGIALEDYRTYHSEDYEEEQRIILESKTGDAAKWRDHQEQLEKEKYEANRLSLEEFKRITDSDEWRTADGIKKLVYTLPPLVQIVGKMDEYPDISRRFMFVNTIFDAIATGDIVPEPDLGSELTEVTYKVAALYAAFATITDQGPDALFIPAHMFACYPMNADKKVDLAVKNIFGADNYNRGGSQNSLLYALIKDKPIDPKNLEQRTLNYSYRSTERIKNLLLFWRVYKACDILPIIEADLTSEHISPRINKARKIAQDSDQIYNLYRSLNVKGNTCGWSWVTCTERREAEYGGVAIDQCRAIPENGVLLYLTAKTQSDYEKLLKQVIPDLNDCNITYSALRPNKIVEAKNKDFQIVLYPDAGNAKEFFRRHPELTTDTYEGKVPSDRFATDYYYAQMVHADRDKRCKNQLAPVHLGGCVYGQYFRFYEDAYVESSNSLRFVKAPYKPIKPSIEAYIDYCNRDWPSMLIAHMSGLYVDYVYTNGEINEKRCGNSYINLRKQLVDPDFDSYYLLAVEELMKKKEIPTLRIKDIPYSENPVKYPINWTSLCNYWIKYDWFERGIGPDGLDANESIKWLKRNCISAPNFVKTFESDAKWYVEDQERRERKG